MYFFLRGKKVFDREREGGVCARVGECVDMKKSLPEAVSFSFLSAGCLGSVFP